MDVIILQAEQLYWKIEIRHKLGIMNSELDNLSRQLRSRNHIINLDITHLALSILNVNRNMDPYFMRNRRQNRVFVELQRIYRQQREMIFHSVEESWPLLHPSISLLIHMIRKVIDDHVQTAVIIELEMARTIRVQRTTVLLYR
ncbi:MAG: hypothetical protein EZS28_023948 [Streblomastix strix]|uniref:Uncharacterized protein n=1 Tax=Streblomastix strix TaxID=222440 RepID=A0A5J4VDH0_9EUKA|nr:MAG: hypothetical protein EZS28_023948 [Streblomastix strix]